MSLQPWNAVHSQSTCLFMSLFSLYADKSKEMQHHEEELYNVSVVGCIERESSAYKTWFCKFCIIFSALSVSGF